MVIFWIKEAIKSIGRAKYSFLLTLISLTIAVILIEASIMALQLSNIFQNKLKNNINISVFIKDPFNQDDIKNYNSILTEKDFIKSVKFVSKEEAALNFINETGEDFRDILNYNPLPASFVVQLNTDVVSKDSLDYVMSNLTKLTFVDEVIFRNKFVYRLLSYLDAGKNYLFIVTGLLIFIAVYLVYSTIKLITNTRMVELETMKLVGAKLSTIKMPLLLNGLFTGFLASLVSIVIYYFVSTQVSQYQLIQKFIVANKYFYLLSLFAIGPTLCLIVTLFALRKLTLKI
ncbi:MAG: permease-like cell division protein FtsX [Ignavibacteriaceae bacterium]|jgi:cell division transport system permease protein